MKKSFLKVVLISSVLVLLAAGCTYQSVSDQSQPLQDSQIVTQPQQEIKIVQKVQGAFGDDLFYIYPSENKTALDLLKMKHTVTVKTYSGIGDMVTGIDGQKPDSKHFWEFFINGKSSNVGAGSYKPVDGDNLEWKLSAIDSSK